MHGISASLRGSPRRETRVKVLTAHDISLDGGSIFYQTERSNIIFDNVQRSTMNIMNDTNLPSGAA